MTKPQSLPVEEARKKFADVLDGSQFRSQHTEITRRGKPAGYVVPPEWYAEAEAQKTELEKLRRQVEELGTATNDRTTAPPAQPAPPRGQEPRPKRPEPAPRRPMTELEAKNLAHLARTRADSLQLKRLEQTADQVSHAYKDFAVVSEAMSMSLLTEEDRTGATDESAGQPDPRSTP